MERMNREQFFAATTGVDRDQLRQVLWQLYWRGPATVRARIEAGLRPEDDGSGAQDAPTAVDPGAVLAQVEDFVALARAGAYLAGNRRVSPKERTRWRFTFRRMVAESRQALRADGAATGAAAMTALIDLACDTRDMDYFRSEDPVEAAGLVVSDEVALLWARVREESGFAAFTQLAAAQLIRWESPYGWTRHGGGRTADKERLLADVAAGMLPALDAWLAFAASYLDALDGLAGAHSGSRPAPPSARRARGERTEALAHWNRLLLDRLVDTEGDALLDRIASHPALGGPELTFVQARLAQRRGETDHARRLARDALRTLPGHPELLAFASEIGVATSARSGDR
jgi:hypothetical protein